MDHYALSGFLIFVLNFILASAVMIRGLYSRINRYFAVLSISVSLYGLGYFLQAVSTSRVQSMMAIRINLLGTAFIPVFFLFMVYSILGVRIRRRLRWSLLGCAVFFQFLNFFTDLLAGSPIPKFGFDYLFQAGPLYSLLFLFFFGCMMLILWKLFQGYKNESISLKRNQLKYFFLACFVGVVGGSPGFMLGYNVEFYPVNPYAAYGVPLYSLICAYAILKYGLLGIRGTLRLLFTPLVSIAVVAYAALFTYDRMFQKASDMITSRGVLVYTVSSIVIFHFIYRAVNFMLVKFFPLRKYEDLLYEFAKKLGRCSELRDIYKESVDVLRQEDSPGTSSAVLLWKSSPGQPFLVRGFFNLNGMESLRLPQDSPLVEMINDEFSKRLDAYKRLPVLIRAELNKICSDEVISRITPELEKFDAQICLPLIYREGINRHLVGFLFLGEPLTSDVYTGADYDFFREVAEQTMLTLINGEARERMGKMEKLAYLGNMAMGWGHQLNNILFRISLRGRMITESLGGGLDQEHLTGEERRKVHTAINDADNLIKAALQGGEVAKDFLRLTKTLKRHDIEQVDLYERVGAAIRALEDRDRVNGVRIRNHIPKDFTRIEGIGYCFEEVFKNLIDNAARAVREQHPRGGGWIKLDIHIPEGKRHVVITVNDNGCGMSSEDVANLGTPLFSVIGKEMDGGRHGLGVSVIYYYIMNIHNGDIKVESSPGKGTSFYITLPIKQDMSPDKRNIETVGGRDVPGRVDNIGF
ncbi:MAG: hypothetical protein GF392_00475 [Candidatus Omnitrophica bacterium]|nr:hypothetical protein [Candidatus Omnitrophota bacterium]